MDEFFSAVDELCHGWTSPILWHTTSGASVDLTKILLDSVTSSKDVVMRLEGDDILSIEKQIKQACRIAGFEIFRNGYAEQIRGILYRFYCTHNTKNTDAQSTYPSPNDLSMNFKYLFFYHFYHFLEPRHSSNMYKQSDRNTRGPGGLKLPRRTGSVAAGYEMHYR